MREKLTRVELFYLEDHVNYWLRFGHYSYEKNIDRRRAFVWFKPYQVFCYIRWWANDYGTQSWTLAILRSSPEHMNRIDSLQKYPGIHLDAELLLKVKGKTYVKRLFVILDQIEDRGIDLEDVSPHYYRYLGQCLMIGKVPHIYSFEQHRAIQKMPEGKL
ncbi:MAG: DUF2840 domain-containing protein [Emcibacter sp.]|nr:DUF2840 domain-containing protein [Emcibacter sp.]